MWVIVLKLEFFQFRVVKFTTYLTRCLFRFYNKQIIMASSLVYDYIGKYSDWIRLCDPPNALACIKELFILFQSFYIIKVSIIFTINMPILKKELQVQS